MPPIELNDPVTLMIIVAFYVATTYPPTNPLVVPVSLIIICAVPELTAVPVQLEETLLTRSLSEEVVLSSYVIYFGEKDFYINELLILAEIELTE